MAHRFLHLTINYSSPFVEVTPPYWLSLVCDDWMKYAPSCWILWTGKTPAQVSEALRPALNYGDTFLILPVDSTEHGQGWAPQWVWDWLNRPRPNNPTVNYAGALEGWSAPPRRRLGHDPLAGLDPFKKDND